jgi:hypothetical protein
MWHGLRRLFKSVLFPNNLPYTNLSAVAERHDRGGETRRRLPPAPSGRGRIAPHGVALTYANSVDRKSACPKILTCPPQIFSATWAPAFSTSSRLPVTTLRVDRQNSDVPYFRRTGNYVLEVCRPGDDRNRALAINQVVHKEFCHSSLNGCLLTQ